MNEVTQKPSSGTTKFLAVIGFIAIVVLAVWLAVQIVQTIPNAFSSLASIADGVYNYNDDSALVVTASDSVVNSGEAFAISWTEVPGSGAYTFSYACAEGLALSIRQSSDDVRDIACNTPIDVGIDTSIDVVAESEKRRFTDMEYTLTFSRGENDWEIIKTNEVTVVNAEISQSVAVSSEREVIETDTPEPEVAGEDVTSGTEVETPSTPTVTPTPQPEVRTEVVFEIPTSNPNGFTDLNVSYLGVGHLENGNFIPRSNIDNDAEGAFRFEVKNNGTKTSEEWTFTATLPNGFEYTSKPQAPLKPNERVVTTLGFETNETGMQDIAVSIAIDNDRSNNNNSFEWTVEVTN